VRSPASTASAQTHSSPASPAAPDPVSSGRSDRHRLEPGGNRRLNSAFYVLAIIRIRDDPRSAVYIAKQRANGKTQKEAIRSLKRHLVRRVYTLLRDPQRVTTTICFDIEDSRTCSRVGGPAGAGSDFRSGSSNERSGSRRLVALSATIGKPSATTTHFCFL
jgi:hypothetical protein